jgi:hypothetical protein
VDGSGQTRQPCTRPAPTIGDDLGEDRQGGLVGADAAEVEADRRAQACELGVAHAGVAEAAEPVVVVRRLPMAPT